MAKSITFMGAPKPLGASGHFDEPVRHSLQAKGILTGNLANNPAVYEQWGITNLERNASQPDVPRTKTGLEDVEAEAKATKQPPKESLSAKFKRMEQTLEKNLQREKRLREQKKRKEMFEAVGKEPPEEKEPEEEFDDEEFDSESTPAKMGQFLADLTDDYSSEEMVGLNNRELETLAVRFHAQTKDGLFGEPENPFTTEIKKRMVAEAELNREKAEVRAELRNPQRQRGFLADLFTDEPETPAKRSRGEEKGLLQGVLGDDEPTTRAIGGKEKNYFNEFFDF